MDKEQIAETVKKCGEKAQAIAEAATARIEAGLDYDAGDSRAAQWMQAKMLGEIACQLAVLNERAALEGVRLENRIAGHATMLLDLEQRVDRLKPKPPVPSMCGAVSEDRKGLCGLKKEHDGKHGWEL